VVRPEMMTSDARRRGSRLMLSLRGT
jgi:hypothetical protein